MSDNPLEQQVQLLLQRLNNLEGSTATRKELIALVEEAGVVLKKLQSGGDVYNLNRTVLDSLTAHIAVLDEMGTIVAVNAAWEKFARDNGDPALDHTGVGINYLEVCRRVNGTEASMAQAAMAGIQAVLEYSQPQFSLEYPCHSRTEKRWFMMSVGPVKNWAGVVVSHINITDRKQMEETLAEERNVLRVLIDHLPDYIYFKDTQSRFIAGNQAVAEVMGAQSIGQLIGKTDFDFYPFELAAEYFADEQELFQTGQALIDKEEPLVDPDGNWRWTLTTKIPLRTNREEIVGLVGIGRDITERKLTQEALRQERDFAESLIQTAQVIILVLDPEGRIILFNPYLEEVTGYSLAEVKGQSWFTTFVPEYDRSRIRARFAAAVTGKQTTGMVSPILTKRGLEREIEWHDKILTDAEGDTIGLLAIGQDITERRQAEEEKERLFRAVSRQREQLRALTGRLADAQETERRALARELHDQVGQNLTALNLNLNTIRTLLSTLAAEQNEPVQSLIDDSLTLLEQTTERIQDVMADLRPPVMDDYGLVAALRWYCHQLENRVEFTITVYGEEPDPRLDTRIEHTLFRIAQEALTNAAKHARPDHVRVWLETDDGVIRLIVSDDGIGFDPAQQSEADPQKGWGLITMSERAEAIGGRCGIESHPGRGTLVIAELTR